MKIISGALSKVLEFRYYRVFFANIYPLCKKLKFIELLRKLNGGSISDMYVNKGVQKNLPFRTYDIENLNIQETIDRYTIDPKKLVKIDRKYKFGFLVDTDIDLSDFRQACKALDADDTYYDIKDPDLFKKLKMSDCDGLFIYPFSNVFLMSVFHEITCLIETETDLKVYPSVRELNIYESKRTLASFLLINGIPHPATSVFYDFKRARAFFETCSYPVVFKTHAGASATGVEILKNKKAAVRLAKQMFFKYYLRRMETEKRSAEWGYMLIQKYIEGAKEYRVIKAGDSWFGYQKWKEENQTFFSGSGLCRYSVPPSEDLLNFCHAIAKKYQFTTMCFDIFQNETGEFLVNELQTWFGSYDPTELYVKNIPGRYRNIEGIWTFEAGLYNVYGSNLLRLAHFISLLNEEATVHEMQLS